MILTSIEFDLSNLLNSDKAVAVCQAQGEHLKSLVFLIRDAGWGVLAIETASDGYYVIAVADAAHQGNLLGDTRRWRRDHGYQFLFKGADERSSTSSDIVGVVRWPGR